MLLATSRNNASIRVHNGFGGGSHLLLPAAVAAVAIQVHTSTYICNVRLTLGMLLNLLMPAPAALQLQGRRDTAERGPPRPRLRVSWEMLNPSPVCVATLLPAVRWSAGWSGWQDVRCFQSQRLSKWPAFALRVWVQILALKMARVCLAHTHQHTQSKTAAGVENLAAAKLLQGRLLVAADAGQRCRNHEAHGDFHSVMDRVMQAFGTAMLRSLFRGATGSPPPWGPPRPVAAPPLMPWARPTAVQPTSLSSWPVQSASVSCLAVRARNG